MALRSDDMLVAPHGHLVRFYEDDRELVSSVGAFLGGGLNAGGAVVVVAEPAHRSAFTTWLADQGIDVGAAQEDGRYVEADCAETLRRFMGPSDPDPGQFERVIGGLLDQVGASGRPLRVFGEMVAQLWRDGDRPAAIRLEELWNELAATRDFWLYCAYPMGAVADAADLAAAKAVCDRHSGLATPPSYMGEAVAPEGAAAGQERSRFFVPVPLAARAVRRFVSDTLQRWGHGDLVDDASLMISELASNAYLHATSPFRVSIRQEEASVRFSVSDASPLVPVCRDLPSAGAGGRGVGIVATLAQHWGTTPAPGGKVVWAELSTAPA